MLRKARCGPDDLHLLGGRAVRRGPGRSTTRRPRPGWSGWPGRSPASWARRNITANVVAPGFVDTDMTRVAARGPPGRDPRAGPAGPLRRARRGRRGGDVAGLRRRRATSPVRSSRSTAASAWGTEPGARLRRTVTSPPSARRPEEPHMTGQLGPDCSPASACSSPASSPTRRWPSTSRSWRRSRARTVVLTGFGRMSLVERIAKRLPAARAGRRARRHRTRSSSTAWPTGSASTCDRAGRRAALHRLRPGRPPSAATS